MARARDSQFSKMSRWNLGPTWPLNQCLLEALPRSKATRVWGWPLSSRPLIQYLLEALFPGVKRTGYEADHLAPTSVDVYPHSCMLSWRGQAQLYVLLYSMIYGLFNNAICSFGRSQQSLACGTAGSNVTGYMDVCLLWMLCVVR